MSGTVNAFYDLAVSPASYDFVNFLQIANMFRVRYGLDDINIVIVPGPDRGFRPDTLKPQLTKEMMLRNVMLPACQLMPSCKSVSWLPDRDHAKPFIESDAVIFPRDYKLDQPVADYIETAFVTANLRDESLTRFTAPHEHQLMVRDFIHSIAGEKKVLTLSLRDCSHNATNGRKANAEQWRLFFNSLDKKEFQPIVITDTEHVFSPPPELAEFPSAPMASLDVRFRTALYEQSYVNFFIPNGPWTCSRFSGSNSIALKIVDNECNVTSDSWFQKVFGLKKGSQVAINPKSEMWVWEDDDFEVITHSFETMRNRIEAGEDMTQKYGFGDVQHAFDNISIALDYTFVKMQRSINLEDMQVLKSIENIANTVGGDLANVLNIRHLIEKNEGKMLPRNILGLVQQLNQKYQTNLNV